MKLLVSDYDGTFKEENNNKNIKANIEAIKKFTKNGNIFALATGRNFTSIKSETTRYNIPYKYLICNDGSTIFNAKDELVYKYPIPENILEESLEYLSSLSYIKKLILLNEFGLETNDTSSVIEIICALNLKNLHKLREMKKNIEYLESISLFNYVSFKNQIINQKLSTYVSFLNKMTGSERKQYTQTLQELENQLLNDNTEIHKTAPASNSTNNIPDSTFSDPSYQKIQNLLSDCTPQEMEWILNSVQLIKDCLRDTK